jgi:hypothetical protein
MPWAPKQRGQPAQRLAPEPQAWLPLTQVLATGQASQAGGEHLQLLEAVHHHVFAFL